MPNLPARNKSSDKHNPSCQNFIYNYVVNTAKTHIDSIPTNNDSKSFVIMQIRAIRPSFIIVVTLALCFTLYGSDEKGTHGQTMLPIVFIIKNTDGLALNGVPVKIAYTKDERARVDGLAKFTRIKYTDSLTTDANGTAVLFVLARWFTLDTQGSKKVSYKVSFKGSVVINGEGFQVVNKSISSVIEANELDLPKGTIPYREILIAKIPNSSMAKKASDSEKDSGGKN